MRPTARRRTDQGGSGTRNTDKGSVRPWNRLPGRCVPCAQSTDSLAPWPFTTSARPDNLGLAERSRVPAMNLWIWRNGGCRVTADLVFTLTLSALPTALRTAHLGSSITGAPRPCFEPLSSS